MFFFFFSVFLVNLKKFRRLVVHLNNLRRQGGSRKSKKRNIDKFKKKSLKLSVRDVEKSQKQFLGSTSVNSNLNFESEKVSFKQQNFSKQTPLDIEKYNAIYKIESDPRMENILRKHVSFLKFKPLSPISTSPERVNTSILSTPIDLMQKILH